ncbi:MAG: universal stress protein [Parachlamydiaceae bacterium]|nr:universal stress protein [Parachlamydiaceae bacterium]
MKILVPSDFSKSSNIGALNAAKFSKKINAEMVLLHVVHFEHPPMVQVSVYIEHKIEDIRIAEASKDCVVLVNELKSKVEGVQISFKIIHGFPVEDTIESYVKTNEIDLIIMGTGGASGLSKVLFGSNAVAVINKSSVPVITVPEASNFNNVKRIVCAFDMDKDQSEIQKIIQFAKIFDASVDVIHILPQDFKIKIDINGLEKSLIEKHKYQKISFHIVHNKDVIEGINKFVADVKADILAMWTHESGFFEKLFKTSFSKEVAFHSLVPLLTFKK